MVPLIATEQHNGDNLIALCCHFLGIKYKIKEIAISALCTS